MFPRPTYLGMLKAVSTIRRYSEDFSDPIARKMRALFMSFNMKVRSDEGHDIEKHGDDLTFSIAMIINYPLYKRALILSVACP